MTAEFATVVPAVIVVLACCLGGVQLGVLQLQLQDAAASAARSAARGDSLSAAQQLVPRAILRTEVRADLVCVVASARAASGVGALGSLTVSATSCALSGGR